MAKKNKNRIYKKNTIERKYATFTLEQWLNFLNPN